MRVPGFRLTVRGWMLVVAVSAVVIVLGIQMKRLARLRVLSGECCVGSRPPLGVCV